MTVFAVDLAKGLDHVWRHEAIDLTSYISDGVTPHPMHWAAVTAARVAQQLVHSIEGREDVEAQGAYAIALSVALRPFQRCGTCSAVEWEGHRLTCATIYAPGSVVVTLVDDFRTLQASDEWIEGAHHMAIGVIAHEAERTRDWAERWLAEYIAAGPR